VQVLIARINQIDVIVNEIN